MSELLPKTVLKMITSNIDWYPRPKVDDSGDGEGVSNRKLRNSPDVFLNNVLPLLQRAYTTHKGYIY